MEILIHELLHMFEKQAFNVERVLFKEVHSESFSQDMRDSFQLVTSRPFFDSSVEHISRPSFAGTSTIGYDGSR